MATYLLIHGAWHGAWCWERVVPLLEAAGHRAIALDLPGHGADTSPRWRVTLGAYADAVREAARAIGGPVIAVGHSMGGLVMTQALHDEPGVFAARVYLCAFVPEHGESLASLGRRDPGSEVPAATLLRTVHPSLRADRVREIFYADCSAEDARRALERLHPTPLRPLLRGVSLRRPVDGPTAYIECTEDRAVSIGHQRWMRGRLASPHVVTMETSHSPFFSAPEALARHLDGLARQLSPAVVA